jgi:hypothetical protein
MFGDRTLKRERLSLARTVLHAAPDWVDLVITGSGDHRATNECGQICRHHWPSDGNLQ